MDTFVCYSLLNNVTEEREPFTVAELADFILKHKKEIDLQQPIFMSSDTEGNQYGMLYQIEISPQGKLILYPADQDIDHPAENEQKGRKA